MMDSIFKMMDFVFKMMDETDEEELLSDEEPTSPPVRFPQKMHIFTKPRTNNALNMMDSVLPVMDFVLKTMGMKGERDAGQAAPCRVSGAAARGVG